MTCYLDAGSTRTDDCPHPYEEQGLVLPEKVRRYLGIQAGDKYRIRYLKGPAIAIEPVHKKVQPHEA